MTTPETTDTPSTASVPASTAASRPLGILSLVLGISAIVTGFSFFLGAAGVALGVLSLRREASNGKMAIWGIVTGAIAAMGTVWGVVAAAAFLPFLGLAGIASWGWGW